MSAEVRRLARSTQVDISVDNVTWLKLPGSTDTAPQFTPNKQDATDYDSGGATSSEITTTSWSVVCKYNKLMSSGVPDPVQETIRACMNQYGDAARLYVRWYDTDGGDEAYQGRAIVELQRSKTAVADIAEITVTLTGDGAATAITNPYSAAVAPVILTASPSGVSAGGQVSITGQHFTGTVATTGVKFGGVNATNWVVVSDSLIVAVMPTGTAGSAPIIVTNATGASPSFAYTRGS